YEVYENRTETNQEVVYYFNLPESAAISGLWLGNSPQRADRFVYQVAPRGAAQAVYNSEKGQRRDPALLEQIGPRQYRLRAFPVQPILVNWNQDHTRRISQTAPRLYIWMTYRTLALDGVWPMPHLAYKNNVFWDAKTTRKLNGKPVSLTKDAWLPDSVPLSAAVEPTVHRADFPGGMSVVAQPLAQANLPSLPADVRLALVIDRSRSMEDHAREVTTAMIRLKELAPDADVYLTASSFRGEEASLVSLKQSHPETIIYFGGQNPAELLAQFNSLRAGRSYDGVLVLTDGGAYELGQSKLDIQVPDAPVWMVHLGSDIPLGYDDKTLELIQASGGGVASSLDQALARLAVDLAGRSGGAQMGDVLDGYAWKVLPTELAAAEPPASGIQGSEDGFTTLLARRLVLAEIRRQRGTISEVATLDQIHTLAKQYDMVTPYSSMIVLVNERQVKALENLEKQEDRFTREYEGLTSTPLVGVPEPEEWLLIGMGALVLAWYVYRSRTARV
ncbi:MAG: TIGR02921 family PEP-CTERM protein, partial [Anaerolineaceae bacterium]|nr:TIGR02921 family PEP-CTERM protein [Anaerolineaceae bacterium]